ncbi:MAG: 50S ribosomal protein L29 [Candidatus Omnitrophica bacterium]|nr:50S ribosomal protein L29 [Candidatus Omnitrophota bacterium]MCB9720695.1 50S ribosomal protein L29 [Candidatus Omnitrophota bacterium]
MKAKELRELSSQDLTAKERAFKKELFDLRNLNRVGRVEKPSRFRELRRDIARILTILKEREINERSASANK